jgi:DnaK suppressor protein
LKEALLQKKIKIEKQIVELKKDDPFNDPDRLVDNAAIDTDVREQLGHDTIEAEIASLSKLQILIEDALLRIQNNSYGNCQNCGEAIKVGRLLLVPEARFCITCDKKLHA